MQPTQPTSYPKLRKLLTFIREARETQASSVEIFPQVFGQLIEEIKCIIEPGPSCPWPPPNDQLKIAYTVGYKDGRADSQRKSDQPTNKQLSEAYTAGYTDGLEARQYRSGERQPISNDELKEDKDYYDPNTGFAAVPPAWHGDPPTVTFNRPDKWPWD